MKLKSKLAMSTHLLMIIKIYRIGSHALLLILPQTYLCKMEETTSYDCVREYISHGLMHGYLKVAVEACGLWHS